MEGTETTAGKANGFPVHIVVGLSFVVGLTLFCSSVVILNFSCFLDVASSGCRFARGDKGGLSVGLCYLFMYPVFIMLCRNLTDR